MADTYAATAPIPSRTGWPSRARTRSLGTTDIPEGLTKVDDHTVEFTLAAPNAVWLRNLPDPAYMIMPKHILEGMDADALKASATSSTASAPSAPAPTSW